MVKPRLNLDELPEEIILDILKNVYTTPIPDFQLRRWGGLDREWARYNQSARDIQNVRLTSRTLSRIGSEVLIQYVGVDLSFSSLTRFQTIMGHPGIRKGVGMVRIRLSIYQPYLCMDEVCYRRKKFAIRDDECLLGPEGKLAEPERLARWQDGGEPDEVKAAIKQSHQEYREGYQAQYSVLKERQKFIQGIADALKMSDNKALRVEFTDRDDLPEAYRFRQSVQRAKVENYLILLLGSPISPREWNAVEYSQRDRYHPWSLAPMLLDILAAFADERINIVDLKLAISRLKRSERETLGKMERELEPIRGVSTAMRNLRNFTYSHDSSLRQAPPSKQKARPELNTLLYRCLPPSLRTLELRSVWFEPREHHLPGLTQIMLESAVLESPRSLEHLLQRLEPHKVAITLSDCSISGLEDSWADILDILRSKQRNARLIDTGHYVGDGDFWEITIRNPKWLPLGPEIASLDVADDFMDPCLQDLLTQNFTEYVRRSQQYIRGDYDINPLRESPH